jgi:hypothetical protein
MGLARGGSRGGMSGNWQTRLLGDHGNRNRRTMAINVLSKIDYSMDNSGLVNAW